MPRLHNKTCLVTGAARGIGAAIAQAFVKEGAHVILTDINFNDVKAEADRLGSRALKLDVGLEKDWLNAETKYPNICLLYTSPSPRDRQKSRMPSSA